MTLLDARERFHGKRVGSPGTHADGRARGRRRPMLEGLDKVDWGSLRHAYGWARQTPHDIRGLVDPDPQIRVRAYDQLAMSIVHQGSLSPAAAAALPFLTEIVSSPDTPDRALVLGLLGELARGRADPLEAIEECGEEVNAEGYLADGSGPWGPGLDQLVRDRLAEGLPVYLALLEDPDPAVRLRATDLLSELPEHGERSQPALLRCLDTETDEVVRANALWVLYRLGASRHANLFARLAQDEEHRLPRLLALGACVAVLGDAAPQIAIDELLFALEEANSDLIRRYNALPSVTEFFHDLAIPLSRTSADRASVLLPAMIRAFENGLARGFEAEEALLTVALGPGVVRAKLDALTDLQRSAILAVARRAFPNPTTTVGNTVTVLRRHGLPDTLEAMEEFRGEPLHRRRPRWWWRFWTKDR